jgi:hypothetical protein
VTLRQRMARDARFLVREDHHGETVTYWFKDGTPERSFLAVVDRKQLEPLGDGIGAGAVLAADVFIPNHATAGVLAIAPGDELSVVLVEGGAPVRCRIGYTLSADAGGFLVRVHR